ncbi:pyroglutamyl-peptidase I [uncultured Clostridium sp.]|uniref:pyroglutamyl-peptidase I n=1 Tax=uncultured Clostridium sp. TaxID=59620 RepID=UPI002605039B|nr:pyroglutamyl-peptidase I [uncultured Clostridium sp.]
MKILLTGFDPFGGEKINPAQEAVNRVSENINGAEVIKVIIPTVMEKSLEKIEEKIKEHNPDIVISIGQATGRYGITPERVGINLNDFRIEDNEGNQPIDELIREDGKNAYFTTLPIKGIVEHLNNNGIPGEISNTAGTFVCNHVMYGVLYMVEKKYNNIKAGFIHIPCATIQAIGKKNVPYMSLDEIVKGIELAIEACTIYGDDIKKVGGAIC